MRALVEWPLTVSPVGRRDYGSAIQRASVCNLHSSVRSAGLMATAGQAEVLPVADRMWQALGLSCRWLDGTVRQQWVGHLPFARRATVNGGFSVRRTGSIDPDLTVADRNSRGLLPGRTRRSGATLPPLADLSDVRPPSHWTKRRQRSNAGGPRLKPGRSDERLRRTDCIRALCRR